MVYGNPALSKLISTIFSPQYYLLTSCLHVSYFLVLLLLFQTFPIIFVIVICDQWHPWCYYCNLGRTVNLAHIRQTHINKCCMCSDSPLTSCLPSHSLSLGFLVLRPKNIEIRPINNPTICSMCSRERKNCTSLNLNQKLLGKACQKLK